MSEQLQELLGYWFGESREQPEAISRRKDFWFDATPADDEEMGNRFGELYQSARRDELVSWRATAKGRLGLIILLDQFPRCLERGTAGAFTFDHWSAALCLAGIDRGIDLQLDAIERAFFYMPLQHAEDLIAQDAGVAAYTRLAEEQSNYRELYAGFRDFAILHRDIIARFGRFPHRNTILHRQNTSDETSYLESGAPTFGQ